MRPTKSEIIAIFGWFVLWLMAALAGAILLGSRSPQIPYQAPGLDAQYPAPKTTACPEGYYQHPLSGSCVPKKVTFW